MSRANRYGGGGAENGRKQKRLYDRRDVILAKVKSRYLMIGTVTKVTTSRKIAKRLSSVGMQRE